MLAIVRSMRDRLVHRGPDDSGEWVDSEAGCAFGFRRLAILDLTPAGHQPMISASGRYIIEFNGEVYNFESIRRELRDAGRAPEFRGHSDTEVMLAAIEAWGIEAAVKRFIGMFAIAIWDRRERRLHLVRDRMGVKPMYYGFAGRTFVFGSELKALRAHPEFDNAVDPGAVALFLKYAYVPTPFSIYRGISKQKPGTIVAFDTATRAVQVSTYWSVREVAERGAGDRFTGGDAEAIDRLDGLLRDAVGLRMIADVPLGVFLSGGIDSSTVTALMQAQSSRPVKTFSIGFREEHYDEAQHAKAIAQHLGTEHTEAYVTWTDALNVVPKLPAMYDEPFADSSQIPTHLVAAMARRHVTVALSGDGGDELFAGYNRYFVGDRLWRTVRMVPRRLRPHVGSALTKVSAQTWNRSFSAARPLLPEALRVQHPGDGVHKLARVLSADGAEAMYFELMSFWKDVAGPPEPLIDLTDRSRWPILDDFLERMMYFDQISYLPDDILVKVDRASMSVSLEAREPLLDHRLIEFAWSLPRRLKVRGGKGKWILRQVLQRYVPSNLIERPKMGFGVPIDEWMRGPLRDWAESLLSESTLREQGLLRFDAVAAKWRDYVRGDGRWHHHLWAVLMLQAWLEETRPRLAAAA
ncbi:MAG TPA: asparagine synthase (glutamine-hydrolyzing) [Thermoanaerobaculia bacterium]